LAIQASVRSTTHLCRPNFLELSTPFLAMRRLMLRFLKAQSSRTLFVVVGFVGVKLLGSLPRSAARTLDRPDAVYEVLEDHRIVYVRGGEAHCERDARSLEHKVALRARLSLIRRIRAGSRSPLLFWRACSPSPKRRAPNPFARPPPDDPRGLDAASPILQPRATPSGAANR
jgi:hypothetical protein